jgi:ACS family glucarate transporter-like MFS transporter
MERARRRLLGYAFFLAIVTYLDRVCISAAAPLMMRDLDLSLMQMSAVFSAFTLAYAVFEVPSGWMGDVFGARIVLTRIVIWWSVFTMLTGAAWNYTSLVVIRLLFGAGEAGAFPNISRAFSRWFSAAERGHANGILFLGSRLGGAMAPALSLLVIGAWGWRASFAVFGVLGFVWAAAWYRWFRDEPPGDLPPEGGSHTLSTKIPWSRMLRSRNLYAICTMYFALGYGLYFYFTWLPTYLIRELGFSLLAGGLFAGLPFVFAGGANVAGGWLTDRLSARRGLRVGRCWLGAACFLTCAALLLASTAASDRVVKALAPCARARRSRSGPQRVLERVSRHRARSRGGRHRLHEHGR